jgi:hypothetical protein
MQGLHVCLTGVESTGKTKLAEQLSRRLGGVLMPEYGREYAETIGTDFMPDVLRTIARIHAERSDCPGDLVEGCRQSSPARPRRTRILRVGRVHCVASALLQRCGASDLARSMVADNGGGGRDAPRHLHAATRRPLVRHAASDVQARAKPSASGGEMSERDASRSTVSLVLLSAAWAMGGFLLASSLIEPLLALRATDTGPSVLQPSVGRYRAAEEARLVIIREAIAAFYENAGRYPKNLD